MADDVTIFYDGSNTIDVRTGRALRLTGEAYPLFRPPDPASVADPADCLEFLKNLHLSLCPVFDIRLRRWMGRYFDSVAELADQQATELDPVAGLDPATSHRAWCYAAYRPLSNAVFTCDGQRHAEPVLLWLADGPLAIRFALGGAPETLRTVVLGDAELAAPAATFLAALGGDIDRYWSNVTAPRHPFVRSALSGLRA
jgi:hypothetical protein